MPELVRVDRTHSIPPGTEVSDKGGTGYLKPSPAWCAWAKDADGIRRRVRLSPVKADAAAMLAKSCSTSRRAGRDSARR